MLNKFEQSIYNAYLKVYRISSGGGFYKPRKDFSDFTESNPNYMYIKKLAIFFTKYKHINVNDFLSAPYEIYKDNKPYYLDFYISQKAITVYNAYIKRLQEQSPDSEGNTQRIYDSLKFLTKFCVENKITPEQYLDFKTPGYAVEDFYIHILERKMSIYVLINIVDFDRKVYRIDEELREIYLGNILDNLSSFRVKLYRSSINNIITNTITKITNTINNK